METTKPRMMEPRDEPHVLTMAETALTAPGERLAILGRYRVPMWVPSAAPPPGTPREIEGYPRALNDREKEALAKVGIGVTVGGVWLDAEALKTAAQLAASKRAPTADRKMTPEDEPHVAALIEKRLGLRPGTIFFDGPARMPQWKGMAGDPVASGPLTDWERGQLTHSGISVNPADEDCAVWLGPRGQELVKRDTYPGPMVPPEQGNAQRPARFAEAMKEIARPTLTALEAQRERDEQQALAMIRERRRPGESEPETLKRLLAEEARFYPALDDDTPQVVRRCSGLPMFQAAAQLAHYITFEVPKLKDDQPVISKPAAEWMRSACMRASPAYQGDLIDWVMDTLRKLAAERDNLQALASLREGCATAWGEVVDLLGPLAEELDDNLGHEGPLDVLRRVLAERAEAAEHDLEVLPAESVIVTEDAPPMVLVTAADVVRFLNARLSGLDFDSCEDVAAYIERITKEQHDLKVEVTKLRATFMPGGAYRWENNGEHRLFHDATGALCYEGPGVKGLVNNRAHPHPGKRPVLFDDYTLALIAQIVNIARDAARETWLAQPQPADQKTVADLLTSLRADGETPPQTLSRVLRERTQARAMARELRGQLDWIEQGGERVELGAALRLHGVTSSDLLNAAARKLRELASFILPAGPGKGNAFLHSLSGKPIAEMVNGLAMRVLDTDAAADALAQLYPNMPASFAGLADVASTEIKQRRAQRAESEGVLGRIAAAAGLSRQTPGDEIAREVTQMHAENNPLRGEASNVVALGRIAALVGIERHAPGEVIEREVEQVRDAAHDGIEAIAENALLRKVKRAAEAYFRAERAPSSARLDTSAPRRELLSLLNPEAITWKGDEQRASGVVLIKVENASTFPVVAGAPAIPIGVDSVKVYVDPALTTGAPPAPDPMPAP